MKRRHLVLACLVVCGGLVLSAQRFTSGVEKVRVDVLVTADGRPLLGLTARDFDVRDNGVAQDIDFVSFDDVPLNVVLSLDSSSSLTAERREHLQSAARTLLGGLKGDDRAALVTFSHVVVRRSALTTDLTKIRAALDETLEGGGTALVDATFSAIVTAESDLGRPILVVFSDGLDTSSWLAPAAVLDIARRSDVVAYTVSVGTQEQTFLRDVSRLTGGRLFKLESTKDLNAVFREILEEFRHRYLLTYSPRGVAAEGWHDLDVRVKRRGATVKARPGYLRGQ
jgi:VWFA-related protein